MTIKKNNSANDGEISDERVAAQGLRRQQSPISGTARQRFLELKMKEGNCQIVSLITMFLSNIYIQLIFTRHLGVYRPVGPLTQELFIYEPLSRPVRDSLKYLSCF